MEARRGSFRENILNYESPVPNGSWEKIKLPTKQSRSTWTWRVAASILLLLGLCIHLNQNSTNSISSDFVVLKEIPISPIAIETIKSIVDANSPSKPLKVAKSKAKGLVLSRPPETMLVQAEPIPQRIMPEPQSELKKGRKVKITLAFIPKQKELIGQEEKPKIAANIPGLKRLERKIKRQYNLKQFKSKVETLFAATEDSVESQKEVN